MHFVIIGNIEARRLSLPARELGSYRVCKGYTERVNGENVKELQMYNYPMDQ
jgi:hypothetical protein